MNWEEKKECPMVQTLHKASLDAEYARLWQAVKKMDSTSKQYDDAHDRICEIEELRNYKKGELMVLRTK